MPPSWTSALDLLFRLSAALEFLAAPKDAAPKDSAYGDLDLAADESKQ